MKNFLAPAFLLFVLLFGLSAVNAHMMDNIATPYNVTPPYNFTPYCYGYMPGFGMMSEYGGMMGPGMMRGYVPYRYGNAPEFGMGSGMMGGMMGGYGYFPSFGIAHPWMMDYYGHGSNSLLWIVITILAATVAYLLGKRSKA